MEKRDDNFAVKMATVLHVYREVDLINNGFIIPKLKDTVTLSFDDKPGIQVISMTSYEPTPVTGKHSSVTRDYEYRRFGTLPLSAGIYYIKALGTKIVNRTHNSDNFIKFLKKLNSLYPDRKRIMRIPDNLMVHI